MTEFQKIVSQAKVCKSSVLNKHYLGISEQWGFLFAESVLDIGKAVKSKSKIGKAPKPHGTKFVGKITKKEYLHIAEQLVKFVNAKGRMKNYCTFKRGDKVYKIRTRSYVYTLARAIVYYKGHKKLPAYVYLDTTVFAKPCKSPYVSSPHYLNQGAGYLGQINAFNCGPHSVMQCLRKFGIEESESTLASVAGTTTSGTDHYGIETAIAWAARKHNIKLNVKWVSFNSLGNTSKERFKALGELICRKNTAVLTHILYSGAGRYYDDDDQCGHYECLDRINTDTGYVRALNSLGDRCNYPGYCGHLQDRPFSLESKYFEGISQKSVMIITKN